MYFQEPGTFLSLSSERVFIEFETEVGWLFNCRSPLCTPCEPTCAQIALTLALAGGICKVFNSTVLIEQCTRHWEILFLPRWSGQSLVPRLKLSKVQSAKYTVRDVPRWVANALQWFNSLVLRATCEKCRGEQQRHPTSPQCQMSNKPSL